MAAPIVLDLETQHKFQDVGYDVKKLKVSVVGVYDYATDKYTTYVEEELPQLFQVMEHCSVIIGFNIRKFDLPVLAPYYVGDISQFRMLDIIEDVEKALGHRLALDDIVRATLGLKKTGHGLLAIDYFREGKWQELKEYCLSDVKITKEIYEYGKKNGKLSYETHLGKREFKVNFGDFHKAPTAVPLSLPF